MCMITTKDVPKGTPILDNYVWYQHHYVQNWKKLYEWCGTEEGECPGISCDEIPGQKNVVV